MKIYKFRSLANNDDYNRLKSIIETGYFRCSNFNELNDPMEGVFLFDGNNSIENIFKGKMEYKICSFSEKKGFDNPAMRSYYANSFKGVVIEIEINENSIEKIMYDNNTIESGDVKRILTKKSKAREHEYEYRFLVESNKNLHKIGKITAIYFGDPYHNISNREEVAKYNENIKEYEKFKNKIINNLDDKIEKFDVFVKSGNVEIK